MAPPLTVRYVPAHLLRRRSHKQFLAVLVAICATSTFIVAVVAAPRPHPDLCNTRWSSFLAVSNFSNDTVALRANVTGDRGERLLSGTFAIKGHQEGQLIDLQLPSGAYGLNLRVDPARSTDIAFEVGRCNLAVVVELTSDWMWARQLHA